MNNSETRYTKTHEWVRKLSDNKIVCGVSKFASEQLGDIVFVDLPQVGTSVEMGKTMGVVESVKTVSDSYAPVSGKVVARNDELEGDPALANQDPMGKGWLVEIEMIKPAEFDELMSQAEYEEHCATAEH